MTGWVWLAVALVAVCVVVAGLWCVWTATRLDALHLRCAVARANLDEHAVRRAVAAQELAHDPWLDLASALLVGEAAAGALHERGDPSWHAQSDLTAALHAVELPTDRPATADLLVAARRLTMARRIHDDAVASTRALRSRRRVRWLRLAGHAAQPRPVAFDDRVPGRSTDWSLPDPAPYDGGIPASHTEGAS